MPRGQSGRIDPDRAGRVGRSLGVDLRAFVVPILLATTQGCEPTRPPVVAGAQPVSASGGVVVDHGLQRQGVASCAASGCHGGARAGVGSGTAYTTWFNRDPHARAYEVLLDRKSDLIMERLAGPSFCGPVCPPEQAGRCLECHVQPGATTSTRAEAASRRDGVDCESCHGAAGKWLEPHTTWGKHPPDDAGRRDLGMTLTRNIGERARLCTSCHVGGAGREVDHDLIAAGHPRLNFELTAYLAALPRHWDQDAERNAQPDFEARAWLIGQVASARSSVALLKSRADDARQDPTRWPELSEYDCFSCHHDLSEPSWRQRRRSDDVPAGALRWGSWYWPLTHALAEHTGMADLEGPDSAFATLRRTMNAPQPDPAAVALLAGQVGDQLDAWLVQAPRMATLDRRYVQDLLTHLATEGRSLDAPGWDQAAQLYLSLAALSRALIDLGQSPSRERTETLQELSRLLQFPDGLDSPRGGPLIPGRFGEGLERIRREPAAK